MYKTVSFNIFDLHLEDVVYKDSETKDLRKPEYDERKNQSGKADLPVLKPPFAEWRQKIRNRK